MSEREWARQHYCIRRVGGVMHVGDVHSVVECFFVYHACGCINLLGGFVKEFPQIKYGEKM